MATIFNIHINPMTLESLSQPSSHTVDDIVSKTFHNLMEDGVLWIVGPHDKFPELNGNDWEGEVSRMVDNANEFYMYSGAEFDLTEEDDRRHQEKMDRWQRLVVWTKRVVSPTTGKQGWKVWTVDPASL